MPWKVSDPMNERMKFVVRHERGERMTDLCREFGISRKTGYKFLNRYRNFGVTGLFDETRSPFIKARKTPDSIECLIVDFKKLYPTWGPRKLKVVLEQKHIGIKIPAHSTINTILKRHNLVCKRRRYKKPPRYNEALTMAQKPNDVWCADFKGQFKMGNDKYCHPLTISDEYSRYIISCEGLEEINNIGARGVFEIAFRRYGLPRVIRTDNGVPFASQGVGGLSKLSTWWIRLGIKVERIAPGHPEQNGRHERMHLTLKQHATRPAGYNLLQQQEKLDQFVEEYNMVRPHEALKMRSPSKLYTASDRKYPEKLPECDYSLYDFVRSVRRGGKVHLSGKNKRFYLGKTLAGEKVGIREVENGKWLVSLMNINLGHVDEKTCVFDPIDDQKVLPMSRG